MFNIIHQSSKNNEKLLTFKLNLPLSKQLGNLKQNVVSLK